MMFTAIGLYLKSRFLNIKTILLTGLGLIITIKLLWLQLKVNRKEKQLQKYKDAFKVSEGLKDLNKKKEELNNKYNRRLRERFPKQ